MLPVEPHLSEMNTAGDGQLLLDRIVDNLHAWLWLLTPEGAVVVANRPFLAATGCSLAEVQGRLLWECSQWSQESAQQLQAAVSAARDGLCQRLDVVAQLADQRLTTLDITIEALRDGDGQISQLVASAFDIGPRLERQRRLEQSEALARELVESTPNALIMVDQTGAIVLVNAFAEQLFGCERDELIGLPVESLVPAPQRHHHHQLRQGFMAVPSKREMGKGRDLFALRRDGSAFPVEIGLNPIESGQGVWVLAAIVDISARKAAQLKLEAALQEKTVLLNEVHHRVKNNLQVISSLLNLQAGRASPQVQDALKESQSRVRAMALIHQLIYEHSDVSRLDLVEYCQRLGGLLREVLGIGLSPVSFECQGEIGGVIVTLQQAMPCGLVVAEAVTNALKHAFPDQRQGQVVVALANDQGAVAVTISDNGVGMADVDQIGKGRTLGAQLMILLAEQLKGSLEFRSQPGQGTDVVVRFKVAHGEVVP